MPISGSAPPAPGTFAFAGSGSALYGQPVYSSGAGLISLAKANAIATSVVVGMVAVPLLAPAAFSALVTAGQILTMTAAQWDAIAGTTGGLANNTTYYLDAATAGHYTATAPTALAVDTVVPLLFALSPTQAVIVIVPPIQL